VYHDIKHGRGVDETARLLYEGMQTGRKKRLCEVVYTCVRLVHAKGCFNVHSSQSVHVFTLQLLKHFAPYSFEWEKVMLRVDDKLHKFLDAAAQAYLLRSVAVVTERSAGL
jgi:hypothetical protein